MEIGSIGSSLGDIQSRMQALRSGKRNITKDELNEVQSALQSSGAKVPKQLQELSKNFDTIDKNGDGISAAELDSFTSGRGEKNGAATAATSNRNAGLTRDDLISMQQMSSKMGFGAPPGMDKLVQNFDKYAGDDGKLSQDEMKSFASENGIQLPPGGPPSGPPSGLNFQLGGSDSRGSKDDDENGLAKSLRALVAGRYQKQNDATGLIDWSSLLGSGTKA